MNFPRLVGDVLFEWAFSVRKLPCPRYPARSPLSGSVAFTKSVPLTGGNPYSLASSALTKVSRESNSVRKSALRAKATSAMKRAVSSRMAGPSVSVFCGKTIGSCCRVSSSARRKYSVKKVRRSEEHTSELQSPDHLVCRLLLEKKKKEK